MATFLFSYRVPRQPLAESLAELDDAARAQRMVAWSGWMESIRDSILDTGNPVGDARAVGTCGDETRVGGYTLISAADFDAALAIARGCPAIGRGGGVEVGQIVELDQLTAAADGRATAAAS